MPNPREAVYDVLLSKAARTKKVEAVSADETDRMNTWAAYEQANNNANDAYKTRR